MKKQRNNAITQTTTLNSAFIFSFIAITFLMLVSFFLAWFKLPDGLIKGYQLLFQFETLPTAAKILFEPIGGRLFLLAWLFITLAGMAIGVGGPLLAKKKPPLLEIALLVITVLGFTLGSILGLSLNTASFRASVGAIGQSAWVFMLLLSMVAYLGLAHFDRHNKARLSADRLTKTDWFIWLGSLAGASIIHYVFVCYYLILPAPKALTKLLTRIRPSGL